MSLPLHHLAALGDVRGIKALLPSVDDINAVDLYSLDTALLIAVRGGYTEVVKSLVGADADVDRANREGQTALILAAFAGSVELVDILLAAKANPDKTNRHGKTALIWAARRGFVEIARALLKANASIGQVNDEGKTALFEAVENGHSAIVEAILQSQDNLLVGSLSNRHLSRILTVAASLGRIEIVQLLLKADFDVNRPYKHGKTALMQAARYDDIGMLKFLIDANANVDQSDIEGTTSLMLAARNRNVEGVRILISAKATVNSRDVYGKTALMYAAEFGRTETVEFLIKQAGADVDCGDDEGMTPLMHTAKWGHAEAARVLIDCKANVDMACENYGKTALMTAAGLGKENIVRMLIAANANVNHRDFRGNTALILACARFDHFLLDQGYRRLLFRIAVILVDQGASVVLKNNKGKSAVDTAGKWIRCPLANQLRTILVARATQLAPLQKLCRFSILTSVKSQNLRRNDAIEALDLPPVLKDYIKTSVYQEPRAICFCCHLSDNEN